MDLNFIKRFFGNHKKANAGKLNGVNKQIKSNKEIVEALLSLIINDDYLSVPIYIHGISCEEQAQAFGTLYPLQYVWNEYQTDAGHLGFSFSINGAVVGSMLEQLVPRTNSSFTAIRDEVMSVLSDVGKQTLLAMVKKTLLPPRQLLKNFEYEDVINLNFNQ